MSEALFRRMASRITNMLARGKVASVKATTKMQTLQVEMLAGEAKDRLEHFEPAGFTSCPKPGAEAVAAFFDGDRSHGVVLIVADRRYRLTTLVPGEVAIFDDQGQKVHITRAGIVVDGGGLPVLITNTPHITNDSPQTTCTGKLNVQGLLTYEAGLHGSGGTGADIAGPLKITGGTVKHNDKNIGDDHNHGGVQPGAANTNGPNP